MIHTYAYSSVMLLADINERYEFSLYLLQFLLIFLVGILQMFERATRVDIVAGVDAYLFAILCGHISGVSREMDIGYEGCHVTVSFQSGRDILHVLCLASALRGETYQFSTRITNTLSLSNAGLCIVGVSGCH